ncbi:hypothetical protein JYT14_00410 [Flavobacteriales bacterium AH-315-E23]|nr:hypothetical protein [Flavobacteriales bacterium AH-315-E23]
MNVLIIGAGATGQIFARHLQDGGARITFLVREKHKSFFSTALEKGLPLYNLNEGSNPKPYLLKNFKVHYSIETLTNPYWEQVWFCVPSNALEPGWISEIASVTGNASLILLSPEGKRRLEIEPKYLNRVLYGYITFIAWQAPFEGEVLQGPEGVAYWFPYKTKVPLRGDEDRLKEVMQVLKKGKMPVVKGSNKSTGSSVQLISSVLMPLVAGLECADWSFKAFSRSKWAKIVAEAAFEAFQITGGKKRGGIFEFLFWLLINPFTLSLSLRLSPLIMPFNFEKYMKFHFMKIREQTKWILKGMLEDGEKLGIATPNLTTLGDQLQ